MSATRVHTREGTTNASVTLPVAALGFLEAQGHRKSVGGHMDHRPRAADEHAADPCCHPVGGWSPTPLARAAASCGKCIASRSPDAGGYPGHFDGKSGRGARDVLTSIEHRPRCRSLRRLASSSRPSTKHLLAPLLFSCYSSSPLTTQASSASAPCHLLLSPAP